MSFLSLRFSDRELASNILDRLYGKTLKPDDLQVGFSRLVGAVDDLALDVPQAHDFLTKSLVRLPVNPRYAFCPLLVSILEAIRKQEGAVASPCGRLLCVFLGRPARWWTSFCLLRSWETGTAFISGGSEACKSSRRHRSGCASNQEKLPASALERYTKQCKGFGFVQTRCSICLSNPRQNVTCTS